MHKGAKESMLQAWLAQLHDLARPARPFLRSRPISTAAVSLGSQVVAQLLEVAPQALATALTTRTMSTSRGSSYSIPLRPSEAEDARDALATSAYSALFTWVVAQVNLSLVDAVGSTGRKCRLPCWTAAASWTI